MVPSRNPEEIKPHCLNPSSQNWDLTLSVPHPGGASKSLPVKQELEQNSIGIQSPDWHRDLKTALPGLRRGG